MLLKLVPPALLAAAIAAPAGAASFNVFTDISHLLLGSFEAPAGGGAIGSIAMNVGGGVYDVPEAGPAAPYYHPAFGGYISNMIGAGEAHVLNSNTFGATDSDDNPVTCMPGDCRFLFFEAFDDTPGEWAIYYKNLSTIAGGYYRIESAGSPDPDGVVPLPAGVWFLAGGLGLLGLVRRRRRA